jgi:predicted transcriptional regulator
MNIQAEKLKLIEWLLKLQDQATIERLKFLRDNASENDDWWETISEAEKESIDQGIKHIEEGKVVPHADVLKKYEKVVIPV